MDTRRHHLFHGLFALVIAALMVVAHSNTASAELPKPGTKITPANVETIKDLVSPGVYWRAKNGMVMNIIPTGRIDWPPPYREATEKYSAQVRLAPNHLSLQGYVAGQPFPLLDENDPDIGAKLIWNVMFRPMWTDDFDSRYFGCVEVYEGLGNPYREIDYQMIGHYGAYNSVGRTEVEPMPADPDFKISDIMFRMRAFHGCRRRTCVAPVWSGIATAIRPDRTTPMPTRRPRADCAGSTRRSWATRPGHCSSISTTRKVTTRKSKTTLIDSWARSRCSPRCMSRWCPATYVLTTAGGTVCPAEWEMRRVYVVETIPNRKKISEELYSKHLVYIDSEADVVVYHDMYDRRGELMVNFCNWLTYRDRPVPDAKVAIYPFKRVFQVNGTRPMFRTACRVSAICRPRRARSANAGTSIWARWIRAISLPTR